VLCVCALLRCAVLCCAIICPAPILPNCFVSQLHATCSPVELMQHSCRLSSSCVMLLTRRWTLASKLRPYSKPRLLLRLCKPGDPNFIMLPHAAVILYYIILYYVMLCYVMLCYVMLCYVMLCYVVNILHHITSHYITLHYIKLYYIYCIIIM